MPPQRLEEKRVEEHAGEGERESERGRKRESARMHAGEKEREKKTQERKRGRKHFVSSFHMFFLPLGLPYANWA